ncbi:RAD50-interacting protein 1-like [Pollicipes pollicipes]|uniref:RAD50-interacting protein 1-like n=1 Tax=Pollicipes pollicipes TaxID=41117 RepID=UPI001884E9A6|nr:RAD50-interacting protein 1-like [Pollicipes pollicipes]
MESTRHGAALFKKLNSMLDGKGDGFDQVQSVKERLQKRKDELEKELAINNEGSDSGLSKLLGRAQSATTQIEALSCTIEPLLKDCDSFVELNRKLCDHLSPTLEVEENRLKERTYRAFLQQLTQLSDALREQLALGQVDEALSRLQQLHARTADVVSDSRCHALAEYCRGLVSAWRAQLLRQLTAALDAALAELRYPFISTNTSVHAAALPVRLLLRPLVRRFVFHFHGDKRTNNPAKPEWYMGQVLQWITDHEQFLESSVEPTLAKVLPSCRPRLEFCRGLVELAVDKLLRDLPELQYDDATLSHTIDEALLLQRQLALLGYGGAPEQPGPLVALCQPACLQRWLGMERKYALERMDQLLASETAWAVQGDPDAGVTEVADGMLTMLQAMTERYRQLPQPGQRLQFLDLQLELLDDLRVRLLQLLRNEKHQPISGRCCALLNTAHHLRQALAEWGEQPAFLHLQFLQRRLEAAERRAAAAERQPSATPLTLDVVLAAPAKPTRPDDQLDGLDTTAFDTAVQLFQRIEDDIVQLLVDQMLLEVRARSRPYRKDAWFSMPLPGEFVSPSLSPTACPMMQVLTQCLHQLKGLLAVSVFADVWMRLARQLNDFLYDELVMANEFNEGGATQLRFDLSQNLVALFGELTAQPERLFEPLLAACCLLTLPTGSALLLRETLRSAPDTASLALAEAGAHGLTGPEALEVLQRRTALSVV